MTLITKTYIAPSLLSADFSRLAEEIKNIEKAGADLHHLDIMDGHFVPNLTFGLPVIEAIAKVATKPLDAHLMVLNPADYIEKFAQLGVKYFSFHIEATHHPHRLIQNIKSSGMKAGIAINPGTPVTQIIDLLTDTDFVLVMSVNPGFSGQKFIPQAIKKIETLSLHRHTQNLSFEIEIDGGINDETIKPVLNAGANMIVTGSYIFGQSDYAQAINSLRG